MSTQSGRPFVVVLAGPNGAGKTTASEAVLMGKLSVSEFVNADWIARGMSGFDPAAAAIAAGRVMLTRLDELAAARSSFAFETTLASRSFAPWLQKRAADGFDVHLFFLWLPNADFAIDRVAARVRSGGHDIPADTIRRRYARGVQNLFSLFMPIATRWTVLNAASTAPSPVARGGAGMQIELLDLEAWTAVQASR